MSTERLLVVSNRLPVSAQVSGHSCHLVRAEGGLACGLRPWHEQGEGLWIGWPGDVSRLNARHRADLDARLAEQRIVPVYLSPEQIERYYDRFSNGVLWPLFHYQVDRLPIDAIGWTAYREVNERFADQVSKVWQPGDLIWVHDYHLMLLPAILRQRLPDARIGYFLHIPFPSSEVFRTLPWRRELLKGLVGADLIGFHTFAYLRHFVTSLLHVDGVEANVDHVRVGDRHVGLGVFPMSVDAQAFAALAAEPDVIAAAKALRNDGAGRRLLLGIDRLDYTKGIPRRLAAFERLLAREPSLRDEVRYVQVAVPSRGEVESYKAFRRQVEETVGRINGSCATLRSTPVHYIHGSVSARELVSLYCAADVMLVTPLRDGMNLVAKEFVSSRVDNDGVLVLSEFAGAAAELGDAIVVNPYDVDGMVDVLQRALAMPLHERRRRMAQLRTRVSAYDVYAWANSFIARLRDGSGSCSTIRTSAPRLASAVKVAADAPRLHLILDYDGTLVPIAEAPELAVPDAELLDLLTELADCDPIDVHIVSGRPQQWLDDWFGHLPIALWAEHGFWWRPASRASWHAVAPLAFAWHRRVEPILEQFAASTPGARIERKTASLAWHYRQADSDFGARQAHELRMLLGDALSNQPLEVFEGKKVIEIRVRGVTKAAVAHGTCFAETEGIIAAGDDRTDEDLFQALPASAVTIAIGSAPANAKYRLGTCQELRAMLRDIAATRARGETTGSGLFRGPSRLAGKH